jgi:hypothetical protein
MIDRLQWYVARMQRMRSSEIVRRCQRASQTWWDISRRRGTAVRAVGEWYSGQSRGVFFFDPAQRAAQERALGPFRPVTELYGLIALRGCPSVFDVHVPPNGGIPDWHRDYSGGRRAPLQPWAAIQHRDDRVVGNIKYTWELNRHAHFVDLARFAWLTGDPAAHDALDRQLTDWIAKNPYLEGVNWGHGLELAVRLISWGWVRYLAPPRRAEEREAFDRAVALHADFLSRYLSFGSSANNHLIGEAAGLFAAALLFQSLKRSAAYERQARSILEVQILRQVASDGGIRERSSGYQLFDVELLQVCDLLAMRAQRPFSPAFRWRLSQMERTLADLRYASDGVWMLKDGDDARVLPARSTDHLTAILNAATLRDATQPRYTDVWDDRSAWLWGEDGHRRWSKRPRQQPAPTRHWAETGWLGKRRIRPDGCSVTWFCDAGGPGLGPLYAHSHSDALQLLLAVDGRPMLVDPGTFHYYADPEWRDYFRSSAAHNVCWWDGMDHGRMRGTFLWDGVPAVGHHLADGGGWVGEVRRPDGSTWTRRVVWDDEGNATVSDAFRGPSYVKMAWQFAPDVDVVLRDDEAQASTANVRVRLELPSGFQWQRLRGSTDPIGGWYSPAFGRKVASVSLVGFGPARAPLRTTIRVSRD